MIFNKTSNIILGNYSGKIVRVIFNSTGPFKVRLTVEDYTKMEGVSERINIPANPSFNPPTNLDASLAAPTITARVTDIEGRPVKGIGVNFLRIYGNVIVNPWSNLTNATGYATTTVATGTIGTIRVSSGRLAHVDIAIP